ALTTLEKSIQETDAAIEEANEAQRHGMETTEAQLPASVLSTRQAERKVLEGQRKEMRHLIGQAASDLVVQVLSICNFNVSVAPGVYRCVWHVLFTPESDFPAMTYTVASSPAGNSAPSVSKDSGSRKWTTIVLEDLLLVAQPCSVTSTLAAQASWASGLKFDYFALAPLLSLFASASGLTIDCFALAPVLDDQLAALAKESLGDDPPPRSFFLESLGDDLSAKLAALSKESLVSKESLGDDLSAKVTELEQAGRVWGVPDAKVPS
ncbi:hypothetical protein T484DRAFT_1773795, partial [Baffinella frigidus]